MRQHSRGPGRSAWNLSGAGSRLEERDLGAGSTDGRAPYGRAVGRGARSAATCSPRCGSPACSSATIPRAEDIAAESVARLLAARQAASTSINADGLPAPHRREPGHRRRRRRATEQRFAHRFASARSSYRCRGDQIVGRAALAVALDQLAPRQRAVLVLRYYEDLSEAAVAELLHIPVGTVKSSASRGLVDLRRLLTEVKTDG